MMRTRLFRTLLLPLLGVAVVLSGCASTKAKKDRPYVAQDVDTLYTAALATLHRHEYKLAAAEFDEVERQHPYSVWARRAELMSAYSYYVSQNYNEAVLSAQRFLALHPGSREAPYAYYVVAISYYEQIASVDRDQKTTGKALEALQELIRRYPQFRICRRRPAEGRPDARPSRRQGDGGRPLLPGEQAVPRGDHPLPYRGRRL